MLFDEAALCLKSRPGPLPTSQYELMSLIKHVTKSLVTCVGFYGRKLLIELLFGKSAADCRRIMNARYAKKALHRGEHEDGDRGTAPSSGKKKMRAVQVSRKVPEEKRIAIIASLLVNKEKGRWVRWLVDVRKNEAANFLILNRNFLLLVLIASDRTWQEVDCRFWRW